MGLSSAILEHIASALAPHAISDKFPVLEQYVVVDDYLTRIRITGNGPNNLLTGLQLFELFVTPILSALRNKCKCWIVAVDIRGRVAAQKYAEQRRETAI
jgi:hypothetical protein